MQNNQSSDRYPLTPGEPPRALATLALPATGTVAVFGPHPDDFDVIAVTLKWFQRRGYRICVAVVKGGSGVLDDPAQPLTWQDKADIREREQRASCALFGLAADGLTFFSELGANSLPPARLDADQQLADHPDNVRLVRAFLERVQPQFVFLPHGNDTNSGHRQMYSLVVQALATWPLNVTLFLHRDPKTIQFRPDVYLPFGAAEAAWKGQLLRQHTTQQLRNLKTRGHGLDDRILRVNRDAARDLGLAEEFAEVYQVELCQPTSGFTPFC